MNKNRISKAKFKDYAQDQLMLIPPSLEDLIDKNHPVRIVNQVLNKIDLTGTKNRVEAFKNALPDQTIFTISAATGKGVKPLIKHLAQLLQAAASEDKK